jgi:HAD superfamily hydrolase (TIGR01450 family)
MKKNNYAFKGLIFDLDGVLWIGNAPMKGAISFLDRLEKNDIPFCVLTNDCSISKSERLKALANAELILLPNQLITAPEITMNWLRDKGVQSIMYLGESEVLTDVKNEIVISQRNSIDAVVIGDLFEHYERNLLNNAAKSIIGGAIFVALQKNARWSDGVDWYIDNGFWVSGLEFVTGKQAFVIGKPHRYAYQSAIEKLGQTIDNSSQIVFVSDDIMSDLKGAKNLGLITVYFGPTITLPYWVDYSIQDFNSLLTLLCKNDE